MDKYLQKAKVLIEALPYIQKFNRKIIVVKYGGSAMSSGELQKNVIEDVTLLKLVGFKPVIVHGGGREISRWVEKVGMEPAFVNGLRVTDEETMEIAEMVLNKVNKSLVQKVQELGEITELRRDIFDPTKKYICHSLFYACQTGDRQDALALTPSEIAKGYTLRWATPEEICQRNDAAKDPWIIRDTAFVRMLLDGRVALPADCVIQRVAEPV